MQRLLKCSSLYFYFCVIRQFSRRLILLPGSPRHGHWQRLIDAIKEVKPLLKVRQSHRVAFFNCVRLDLIS